METHNGPLEAVRQADSGARDDGDVDVGVQALMVTNETEFDGNETDTQAPSDIQDFDDIFASPDPLSAARAYLVRGHNINAPDENDQTLFDLALENEAFDLASWLLKNNADPRVDVEGVKIAYIAGTRRAPLSLLTGLLEHRGAQDTPALQWAAKAMDVEKVGVLLAAGCPVDARQFRNNPRQELMNFETGTALQLVIDQEMSELTADDEMERWTAEERMATARLLLEAGADTRIPDAEGQTVFTKAERKGLRDLVTLLREYDRHDTAYVEVDIEEEVDEDAYWAERDWDEVRGQKYDRDQVPQSLDEINDWDNVFLWSDPLEAARILIARDGEDSINRDRGYEEHALNLAISEAASEGSSEVVFYLLERGADPNQYYCGLSPLETACRSREIPLAVVTELLRRGAETTKTSALRYAVGNLDVGKVRVLLENGVDPDFTLPDDHTSKAGWTPLHLAVDRAWDEESRAHYIANSVGPLGTPEEQVGIVRILTAAGADPSLRNEDGDLPVDLARRNKLDEIVSILEALE